MDPLVELASMFKEREYKPPLGVMLGNVISVSPPQISISEYLQPNGNKVVVTETYRNKMQVGDQVIVISSNDNQKYFVIDKVVTG